MRQATPLTRWRQSARDKECRRSQKREGYEKLFGAVTGPRVSVSLIWGGEYAVLGVLEVLFGIGLLGRQGPAPPHASFPGRARTAGSIKYGVLPSAA